MFSKQAEQELLRIVREFQACKQEEGRVQKNKKNKPHKAAKGGHGKGKGKMRYAPNTAPYAPEPKTPPPPKKDNPAKDAICHQCDGKKPYSHQVERDKDLLGLIHTDVCGPFRIVSGQGANYFITFTDYFSRYSYVYLLKHKHEVFETFKVFQKEVENQLGKTIKSLRSDRGCEYMSQEFLDHLKKHGIIAHRTPPYTPQHNGVSKRRNRTLLDMVQSMMSQTTLPMSFWDYALETAIRILNMVPTKKALVKRDTLTKPDKLDPRSFRCIFVGYPKETIGYSFYNLSENKVFVARNVEFFENGLIDLKASGSVEDLKLIQEEDTNPSLDTSLDHEEDDQEIDEPQSDINPIRKSSRTRHALDRMCLYIDAEEHELGDLDNDVWVLVELPTNAKTVSSKWLFKKRTDMDGAVYVFKARLVVKGFTQTYGVDYEETFSPVADIRAIRIIIAIVAYYNYEIWQMDVKNAFLNGHLSEEVYMEQPGGFVNPKYPNHTGYVFVLNGGAVNWKSTKQSIFATSSTNVEYIAAFNASKEAVWICKFIYGLGTVPTIEEPISMYCDNTGAIAITKDDGVTKGSRHYHTKVHYLRETIKLGDVKIEKVDTNDNLADPFTKALAFLKHSKLTRNIIMLTTSSFMSNGMGVSFDQDGQPMLGNSFGLPTPAWPHGIYPSDLVQQVNVIPNFESQPQAVSHLESDSRPQPNISKPTARPKLHILRKCGATDIQSPSQDSTFKGAMISPVSDKHFWSVLRNRIDTLLENQKGQVLVSGFGRILVGFVF
nr:hypothetical protein [Tanacetum cinerariifolium]